MVMAGILAATIAFFFFITTRFTTPSMGLLYSDLDPTDSGRIVAKLDTLKVPYELQNNGEILVPSDQILKLRMSLAQEGLPTGGSVGYELFDRSEAFGTSTYVLDIQRLRALEGELARTIRSLNYVKNARVHLVLPKREAFSRDPQQATASVLLEMVGGRRISRTEVRAIQNLIASAVPKLDPSRITIVDNQGTLLASGEDKSGETNGVSADDDLRVAYETKLARTIDQMLERTVGPGRVRAEVTADMDFDHVSTTTEKYDPDGQVVRSTQTVEDASASKDADSQPVTVANNLPAAPGPTATPSGATNKNSRTEETVNYEISKTTQTHVREGGNVKRLSVAVLVDGTYDGTGSSRTYKPRTPQEMATLTKLVQSAVGYDPKRGDTVEVVNLRFAQGDDVPDEPTRPLFGLTKNDYMRIAELVVMGVVAILILLMVVRPLMKRVLEALPDAIASSKNLISESIAAAQNTAMLPNGTGGGGAIAGALGALSPDSQIDLAQVEGRVRESTVKKVGEIVDKHPEEAVNIIRNWMYQQN